MFYDRFLAHCTCVCVVLSYVVSELCLFPRLHIGDEGCRVSSSFSSPQKDAQTNNNSDSHNNNSNNNNNNDNGSSNSSVLVDAQASGFASEMSIPASEEEKEMKKKKTRCNNKQYPFWA